MMQKRKNYIGPPRVKAFLSFVLVTMIFKKFYRTAGWNARMMIAPATSVVGQKGMSITDWTKPFCQSWSASDAHNRSLQPFDLWHMHHPNWIVTNELAYSLQINHQSFAI
jgi:hypothetical protein